MTRFTCPGQDLRYWKPDDITYFACPWCDTQIEFWKDEAVHTCPGCAMDVCHPRLDLACARWCKFADECLPENVRATATRGGGSLADTALFYRIIAGMRQVFGADTRRIRHAARVTAYAIDILATEPTADALVVRAAAILHDIGILEAERRHGSSAGMYQEIEGPPIARAILERLQVAPGIVDHVCRIVGSHHSARDIDTIEFRIVWDADWLVNIPDEHGNLDPAALAALIARVFRTAKGRALAEGQFLARP